MVCFNKPVQGEKIESVITQSGCKKTSKKRTDSSCMLTRSGKKVKKKKKSTKSWRTLIHRMITKQQVKNQRIKRKQTCSLCFVNVFKFQENKFKIVQKNFQEIKIIIIKKATTHNDH